MDESLSPCCTGSTTASRRSARLAIAEADVALLTTYGTAVHVLDKITTEPFESYMAACATVQAAYVSLKQRARVLAGAPAGSPADGPVAKGVFHR